MAKRRRAGEHNKASPPLFAILIPAIGAWSAPGSAQTPLTMDTCRRAGRTGHDQPCAEDSIFPLGHAQRRRKLAIECRYGFRVVVAGSASGAASTPAAASAATALTMDFCPNNFSSIPMDTPPIACGCPAEAAKKNDTVWGANPYYYGSSICRAAVHAGAMTAQGGQIVVEPADKVLFFPSVTKNGVESSHDCRFPTAAAGACARRSTPQESLCRRRSLKR
jgi:hypothetical protein